MKKLTGIVALLTSSIVSSSMVFAGGADIRVSGDAVSLYLEPQPSPTNSAQLALIYNNDDNSALLSAGLFANGERQNLKGRLGGKLYYADLDHDSGYGVALGGDFSLAVNRDLHLGVGGYYSPGSLSFSDIDGYKEWYVKGSFQVFQNAAVGVGYQSVELNPEKGRSYDLNKGVFVEMNLRF